MKRNVGVLIEESLEKQLRIRAAELGRTKSSLMRGLIHAYLHGAIELPDEYIYPGIVNWAEEELDPEELAEADPQADLQDELEFEEL